MIGDFPFGIVGVARLAPTNSEFIFLFAVAPAHAGLFGKDSPVPQWGLDAAKTHTPAYAGDASVREQLATLAAELPVDPVIVRAQWPGMDIEAVEEYLAVLGKEIVQPLADVPVRDATLPVTP